jgi:hypothetical protein
VPGFSQSGSPARCLVIWSFAWSVLAAFGFDSFEKTLSRQQLFAIILIYVALLAVGFSAAASPIPVSPEILTRLKIPAMSDAMARIGEDWIRLTLFFTSGVLLFLPGIQDRLCRSRPLVRITGEPKRVIGIIVMTLVVADLFVAGIRINPVAGPDSIYPETPGIKYLRANVGHDRILPVNMFWSLYKAPLAVLPPNGATVYELRDVQGYDSLLTGAYKSWADRFALPDPRPGFLNRKDSAPVEVANMIFFQDPNLPEVAGTSAAFALTASADDNRGPLLAQMPNSQKIETGDEGMDIFPVQDVTPRAQLVSDAGAPVGAVEWIEDGPSRVVISTKSDTGAILNLNDQMYPGWRVTIDGASARIVPQTGKPIFRSVTVPAGKHTVAFTFAPDSFRLGLYLSLIAFTTIVGMCAVEAVRIRIRV